MRKALGSGCILSFCFAFTLGCGDAVDTTDDGNLPPATPAELRGRWQSDCVDANSSFFPKVQREYAFNTLGDFDRVESFYGDADCTRLLATYKVIGTVAAGEPSDDPALKLIDFTVNDASLELNDLELLSALNSQQFCGRSDWKLGEQAPLLGSNSNCAGFRLEKGSELFDIYSVENGELYLGQPRLFLVPGPSGRPQQLNKQLPLRRPSGDASLKPLYF